MKPHRSGRRHTNAPLGAAPDWLLGLPKYPKEVREVRIGNQTYRTGDNLSCAISGFFYKAGKRHASFIMGPKIYASLEQPPESWLNGMKINVRIARMHKSENGQGLVIALKLVEKPASPGSSPIPFPSPTPAAQPASEVVQSVPENISVNELLSSGRQLNKRVFQKGLTPELRTEIESWLSVAKARIDIFNKSGEAKDYDDHRTLAEQINKFEVRLGIGITQIDVKLPKRPDERRERGR